MFKKSLRYSAMHYDNLTFAVFRFHSWIPFVFPSLSFVVLRSPRGFSLCFLCCLSLSFASPSGSSSCFLLCLSLSFASPRGSPHASFVVFCCPSHLLVDPLELRSMYGALQLALQCIGYLGGWELYTHIDIRTKE